MKTGGTMKPLCCLLILLLAGAASGTVEKRVVGSTSCKKERQYHVQVEAVQGGKTCGGSLINTRWVLTASHCAEQMVKVKLGITADLGIGAKVKGFFKGIKSFFTGKGNKNEQTIDVKQQFTFKQDEQPHDIMLIKLNEDVSAKLPVARLPPVGCTRPEQGQQVRVGGWGAKTAAVTEAKNPKNLKCASTEISNCDENDKPDSKYQSDESTTMCAFKPGVEACFGDGGSAVEYNDLLHGIVVSNPVDKCANPIVMLDICHYREWIDTTMRQNP